jgi:hypothetical protein
VRTAFIREINPSLHDEVCTHLWNVVIGTSTRPHGTISQKAVIFILAAVKTWNLKKIESKIYISEVLSRCEISSSHGGWYDVQNCLLGYTAV